MITKPKTDKNHAKFQKTIFLRKEIERMKKQYRVVSLLIVLSLLLASFMFVTASAEETSDVGKLLDGYTSVPNSDGAALINAIKYTDSSKGTNLLSGAGITSTNATDTIAWGNEGGRGSDLITAPDGNVLHKEYLVGTAMADFAAKGNDYINYNFTKVDNTKKDGVNEYIVVDFDFAYEGTLDGVAMQVITRGNGAYWASTQSFSGLGAAVNTFVHVTAVYEYQNGAAYYFVNNKLVKKVNNGALTAAGLTDHNNGVTMGASEFRVGSNSTSTFYLDNLYVRNFENSTASDDLATVLSDSNIASWSKNVYTSSYTLPEYPYFAESFSVETFTDNKFADPAAHDLAATVNGDKNILGYVATGNDTNSSFITLGQVLAADPYVVAYCNTTTNSKPSSGNNLFINANASTNPAYTVVGSADELKAYYVIDFDVASYGNVLPDFDVSVIQRRTSDGAGYPFSDEIYVDGLVKETGAWAHITIIGDIHNNVAKVYLNGKYVGDNGLAVRNSNESNKLANDTQVKAMGFRIELTRNNVQVNMHEGDNVAFDNFSQRVYTDGNDALKAALADGNITDWAGYTNGRAGEMLATIAKVNGTSYSNTNELEKALYSNEQLNVEFMATPFTPVNLRANATVNTHGLGINNLVTFDPVCSEYQQNGNRFTVTAPFSENKVETSINYSSATTADQDVIPILKSGIAGNLFYNYGVVSGTSVNSWGTTGYRVGSFVTNPMTGDTYYHETATPNAEGKLNAANEYINFNLKNVDGSDLYLTYESGKNEYIVVDFDFAHDQLVDSSLAFSIIPRKSGSGRWGSNMYPASFGLSAGETAHITVVADYTNNISYVYINGAYHHTVSAGPINSTGHTEYKNGATDIKVSEFKMGSNSLNSVYLANLAVRYFDLAESEDVIKAAISTNNISNWYGSIYNEDYHVPQLPGIASVNGVEYSSKASLEAALATAGDKTVNLLHSTTEKITVNSNATITTNGLVHNFSAPEGGAYTERENVITIRIPNYKIELAPLTANDKNFVSGEAYFDTVKYDANDNLFNKIDYNNYNASTFRAAYMMTNLDTGEKYAYDTIYDTTTAGKNTYMNWYASGDVSTAGKGYTAGVNQYFILDFDMAMDAYSNTGVNLTTRNAANNNIAGAAIQINTAMQNAGIPAGEFAHITFLAEIDSNTLYVYVNGVKSLTVNNGVYNNSYPLEAGHYLDGIRFFQNLDVAVKYDNIYMRTVNDASLKDLNTLIGSQYNVYTDSYKLPTAPVIATVDGVDYRSTETLTELLNARRAVGLATFHHSLSTPIPVTVDAVVETYGFPVTVEAGEGASISKTEGTKLYFVGVFKPSATDEIIKEDGTAASFTDLSDTSVAGNLFNGNATEGNPGSFRYVKYTGFENNDPYLLIQPIAEKTPGNTYINMSMSSKPAITATSYFVFNMDVATETDFMDKFGISIVQRSSFNVGTNGTDFNKVGDTTAVVFDDFIDPSDEWAHLTIVGDLADNKEYVFVNGTLVGELTLVPAANYDLQGHIDAGNFICDGVRVNMPGSVAVNLYDTALIDNLSLVYYNDNTAAGDVEAAISAGTLAGYANAVTGRAGEVLPSLVTVNGVEHGNYYKAAESLVSDRKINASLDRQSVATKYLGDFIINALGTVKTNGFSYGLATGLTGALDDGILTITIDEVTGHVQVIVSGVVIYDDYLVSGTDVAAILKSFGSYENKVVVGNGNIFLNVTWDNAPGVVNGDTTFVGTGTLFTEYPAYIYYTANGNQVDPKAYGYDAAGMKSWFGNGNDFSMILNQNVEVESTASIHAGNATQTKNIYLNGYTMSFTGSNHAISASGNAKSLNFYGPGIINDLNHTSTHAFLFSQYNWTGKVTLNNLSMNLSQRLAQLRDGNLEVNNCEINAISAYDTEFINIGEDYNGNWTKNPISVVINDSYIRFTMAGARQSVGLPFISHKVISEANGTDPVHTVNISGSTIITEFSFYELTNNKSGSNTLPTVENSTIIAATLSATNKISFLGNVQVNSNMENLNNAILADGLEIAKTNDHMADVMYTDYYATVTWADGTVELWADGTTPTNANYPLAIVSKVDGYGEYRFAESYSSAPFALNGNLTLGSSISFNIYVDFDSVSYITVNGKKIYGENRSVAGEVMTCFAIELTPAEAAYAFDVIFAVSDGNTVVRTMSVADYAAKVFAAFSNDAKTKKMMSSTLEYIVSAAQYFGYKANYSAVQALLNAHPAVSETNPTTSSANADAIAEYITGAQLNALSTLKFRFNLANGVDASAITITVNGAEKTVENHGSYIEVALRAYEMADMITITVNGKTGTYDLAKYVVSVLSNTGTSNAPQYWNTMFSTEISAKNHVKGNLLNAIYSYAIAASEYKA